MGVSWESSYFNNLLLDDFARENNLSSQAVTMLFKKNGYPISTSSLKRYRSGDAVVPKEMEPVLYKVTGFSMERNEKRLQDLKGKILSAYKAVSERIIYGQMIRFPENWFEDLRQDEDCFLNSPFRFSYQLLTVFDEFINGDTNTALEMALEFENKIHTDRKFRKPVLHPDEWALCFYMHGLCLLRKREDYKAITVLNEARVLRTDQLIDGISRMVDYNRLRCLQTWSDPQDAIHLADHLCSDFCTDCCYHRAWNTAALKVVFLTRLRQFRQAEWLLDQLERQALLNQNRAHLKMVFQNRIWLDACRERFDVVLSSLSREDIYGSGSSKLSIWKPLALYWEESPEACLQYMHQIGKNGLDQEDQVFYSVLEWFCDPDNGDKTEFPFEEQEAYFARNRITEMITWLFHLKKDHLHKQNRLLEEIRLNEEQIFFNMDPIGYCEKESFEC